MQIEWTTVILRSWILHMRNALSKKRPEVCCTLEYEGHSEIIAIPLGV